MKKILVTGAAGTLGIQVLRYLLIEGKYEITALDLKNAHTYNRLKKYRKRINIVFGDVNDTVLMDYLVKTHDYIIHLAGIMPPFADVKEDLCRIVDYDGTKNIIDSIVNYNPKCFLIYVSSTTIYNNKDNASVKNKINIDPIDYYTSIKYSVEKLIKDSIKNYTIIRVPLVLCNVAKENFMYNVPINSKIETITSYDAGYALAMSVEHKKELNKKIFNLGGGEKCRTTYKELLIKILKTYGISFKYILAFFLADKNFYSNYYDDSDELEKILMFRKDSLAVYYNYLDEKYSGIRRFIPRLLAKPIVKIIEKRRKDI